MGMFASSAMLLWGAVITVPIILHLIRRHRRRKMAWGAMRFLAEAVSQSHHRFRLWQWLLLGCRILVIILLALALARPLWPEGESVPTLSGTTNRLRVLIVDASASMQARLSADGATLFQRARDTAAELCRSSLLGDAFLLVSAADQPRVQIGSMSFQKASVVEAIQQLEPGDTSMDLGATIQAAEELITQAIRDGWRGPIEIVLFSDMQEASWGRDTQLPVKSVVADQPVSYLVVDCGFTNVPANIAAGPIVWSDRSGLDPIGVGGQGSEIDGTLRWTVPFSHLCGDEPVGAGTVQLRIDGRIEQTQEIVGIRAGETVTTAWSTRLSPGSHLVEILLEIEDSLPGDNLYGEIVTSAGKTDVVLFGPTAADRQFVELAIEAAGGDRFQIRSASQNQLRRTPLDRDQVWILCNPQPLDDSSLKHVDQYWRRGGSVIWWLGPQWQESTATPFGGTAIQEGELSQVSGGEKEAIEGGLAPFQWRALREDAADRVVLDPLEYHSPILAPFRPYPNAGLVTLPVFRWWQIELGTAWNPALTIRNQNQEVPRTSPLLATLEMEGSGRQVLIASPPGPGPIDSRDLGNQSTPPLPWNAIVTWPVFLPLVQETVRWSAVPPMGPQSFRVGERLYGYSESGAIGKDIRGPGDELVRVVGQPHQGSQVRWATAPIDRLGKWVWNDGVNADVPAAYVNFAAAEGDLSRIDRPDAPWTLVRFDQLPSRDFEAGPLSSSGSEANQIMRPGDQSTGGDFGWLLLLASLATLVAESVVARLIEERF